MLSKEVCTGFEFSHINAVSWARWCGAGFFTDHVVTALVAILLRLSISRLFWYVPGCSEGAEECQTGMPKTRTVQNAICLGSKVRENAFYNWDGPMDR